MHFFVFILSYCKSIIKKLFLLFQFSFLFFTNFVSLCRMSQYNFYHLYHFSSSSRPAPTGTITSPYAHAKSSIVGQSFGKCFSSISQTSSISSCSPSEKFPNPKVPMSADYSHRRNVLPSHSPSPYILSLPLL